jgi:hypothetical protein
MGRADEPGDGRSSGPSVVEVADYPVIVPDEANRAQTAKPARRTNPLIEVSWLVFLVWIYSWLQDLAPLRQHLALVNASHLLSFERRFGLDPERALDHWLAHHNVLAFVASNFYDNAIFAITFGFAILVWWRRPDLYRPLRNDLVLANLLAFLVFWAWPVAPPRMLPGYVDVVKTAGGLGAWHDTLIKHADQLAAMPSMHLGYAVWCSIVAWRMARSHGRKVAAIIFGVGYPALTAVVVMATGNHYLMDVVAGAVTTFVAVALVEVVAPPVVGMARAHLSAWANQRSSP